MKIQCVGKHTFGNVTTSLYRMNPLGERKGEISVVEPK